MLEKLDSWQEERVKRRHVGELEKQQRSVDAPADASAASPDDQITSREKKEFIINQDWK